MPPVPPSRRVKNETLTKEKSHRYATLIEYDPRDVTVCFYGEGSARKKTGLKAEEARRLASVWVEEGKTR